MAQDVTTLPRVDIHTSLEQALVSLSRAHDLLARPDTSNVQRSLVALSPSCLLYTLRAPSSAFMTPTAEPIRAPFEALHPCCACINCKPHGARTGFISDGGRLRSETSRTPRHTFSILRRALLVTVTATSAVPTSSFAQVQLLPGYKGTPARSLPHFYVLLVFLVSSTASAPCGSHYAAASGKS